jgi:hypothetical protein
VNEVISKRFVTKQQMHWTKEEAHQLLEVRIQVLNEKLQQTFHKWYPGMCEKPLITENDKAALPAPDSEFPLSILGIQARSLLKALGMLNGGAMVPLIIDPLDFSKSCDRHSG